MKIYHRGLCSVQLVTDEPGLVVLVYQHHLSGVLQHLLHHRCVCSVTHLAIQLPGLLATLIRLFNPLPAELFLESGFTMSSLVTIMNPEMKIFFLK